MLSDTTEETKQGTNNNNIGKDIPVGVAPRAIGVDELTDKIYVANSDDNTVSVIDGKNNTKIVKDIPVGKNPSAIGVDESTNKTYVANWGDNTVSLIDPEANKVVARVMFETEPFNAGYIECDKDKLKAPILQQIYISIPET